MNKITERLDKFLSAANVNDWPDITVVNTVKSTDSDNPNTITLSLIVNAQLSYLEGHFPDKPVVPGVVQVHWASLLARCLFTITGVFLKMENVKFQSMILPEQTVELTLTKHSEKKQIAFNYRLGSKTVSEGKLYFHG
ncbi:MAG: 3-hydroxymyristoyl/3-hydroxydecanoyl-(acyl carrier protein) dehydratase [Kiritimatiellia bacterium]|jgi:3-hydroxymyristoyl/3-hydroxydecanoyl-(acyl carrier protein) dehydratase